MAGRPIKCFLHGLPLVLALSTLGVALAAPPAPKQPGPTDEQKIAKLIESLGDKEFAVRQRAEEELARIGFAAYEALAAAANHEDLEIAARARYLLRKIRGQWTSGQDSPEVQNLLEDYDLQSTEERAARIRRLAFFPDLSGTAALCRLIRFERSAVLSDYAAIEIAYSEPFDAAARTRFKKLVEANLAGSTRPAATWLRAYARLREDPKAAFPEWRKLVEAACARWQQSPDRVNPEIAVSMLYLLAHACADQGDRAAADKTAQQAQQMPRPSDSFGLNLRMQTAWMLGHRGRSDWAEAEYNFLTTCGQPQIAARSGLTFAEYLHDQEKDLAAAEACNKALDAAAQLRSDYGGEPAEFVRHCRSRMNYFFACHWARQKDPVKQLDHLERALQSDPGEVDTLIACHRFPSPTPQFRERIAKSIQQQTVQLRDKMAKDPKSALPYNQFAWLVGNTQGDLDAALRASQKSLELSPNTSAYLDTIAHVYFAKGDLANAVKHQTMAAQREPHSGLLNSELKRFRAALEAKTKKVEEKPQQ
jgi:hypothetical protein